MQEGVRGAGPNFEYLSVINVSVKDKSQSKKKENKYILTYFLFENFVIVNVKREPNKALFFFANLIKIYCDPSQVIDDSCVSCKF